MGRRESQPTAVQAVCTCGREYLTIHLCKGKGERYIFFKRRTNFTNCFVNRLYNFKGLCRSCERFLHGDGFSMMAARAWF